MGLNFEIPKDINKIKQQIKALEYQLQQDTNEKDVKIHGAVLKKLNEALLYEQYLELQSKEFKENVIGYKKLTMHGKDIAIKVNFTQRWLHVYRTKDNQIEWY
jgi:hypothetical protein